MEPQGPRLLEVVAQPVRHLAHLVTIGEFYPAGPAHDDGLQVLGAHHRAQAGAACGPVDVVDDAGVAYQVLTRHSALSHADALVPQFILQDLLHLGGLFAPQVSPVADLYLVVLDPQVDGFLRLTGDDDRIPTGAFQFHPPEAAYVSLAETSGEGRPGPYCAPATASHRCAGHHPGGKDEQVVRSQGISPWLQFLEQVVGDHAPAAKVSAEKVLTGLFHLHLPGRQINAQNFVMVTTRHCNLLLVILCNPDSGSGV